MPIWRFARPLILAALISSAAAAQQPAALLPLPQLEKCGSASHTRLPEKWRAVYLMAPFTKSQLVLGEIVSDASLSAMRVKLYGVRGGSADLFVRGRDTYVLESDGAAIKQCHSLGDTGWRPLPRDWLTRKSQCVGSAPIGGIAVDWWKTAIEPWPASYWIWSSSVDQIPLRLVFPFASDRLPVLSRYALSHRVGFEPLAQSELEAVAAICKKARTTERGKGARALRGVIDAMAQARHRADGEIARLMPALDMHCVDPLPRWPEQLAITGLMTPFDSDETPYPAEVFYDWSVRAQRTRIFGQTDAEFSVQDSLLLGPQGYVVTDHRRQGLVCRAVLPGVIRPDWAERAPCECAAVIKGTTPLTPHGTAQILACPLASPRVAWTWYAIRGRPMLFMVTSLRGDEGSGLFAVLDYGDWLPGHAFPHAVFDKPAQCAAPNAALKRSSPHGRRPASSVERLRCATCHLGRPAAQR